MKEQLLEKIEQLDESKQEEVLKFVEKLLLNKAMSKERIRKAGSMKGLIKYMSDDFDAPLDDFKDYM